MNAADMISACERHQAPKLYCVWPCCANARSLCTCASIRERESWGRACGGAVVALVVVAVVWAGFLLVAG
jgi:hypothetical protein